MKWKWLREMDWNDFVAEREKSNSNEPVFYRKTAQLLEQYFQECNKKAQIFQTILEHKDRLQEFQLQQRVCYNILKIENCLLLILLNLRNKYLLTNLLLL